MCRGSCSVAVMSTNSKQVLHSQARTVVAAVIQYFYMEKSNLGPLLDVKKVLERVSAACNVSKRTVIRINAELNDAKNKGNEETTHVEEDNMTGDEGNEVRNNSAAKKIKLTTPRKTPGGHNRKSTVTDIDEFGKSAIRRHILQYYERQELPSPDKLQHSLKAVGLFNGGKTSLYKIVRQLGFTYKKFNHRKVLMEKPSIALLRCQFLRKIKNCDLHNVVFLDETWLNENVHQDKGWTDDSIKATPKAPIGKGKRLIICHAGSQRGWIDAPPLVFESKKTGDYHEEMDHLVFENWFFNTLIPILPPGSTIIMDNAPYHSRKIEKPPTSGSTKTAMIQWLTEKNIPFSKELLKPEIYQLVKLHKSPLPKYAIDSKATELGFKVIRLPPYHCHYNAIEMVWSYLKAYVKERNKTFKLKDVKRLFMDAVNQVTPQLWSKYVQHVKTIIDRDWENEGLQDRSVQQLIINLCPGDEDVSDSDFEQESDDDDIGCFPLE